jgi:hypothetical protein
MCDDGSGGDGEGAEMMRRCCGGGGGSGAGAGAGAVSAGRQRGEWCAMLVDMRDGGSAVTVKAQR